MPKLFILCCSVLAMLFFGNKQVILLSFLCTVYPNLFRPGGKLSNKLFETKQYTAISLFLRRTLVRLDYELSFTEADVLVVAKLRLPFVGGCQRKRSANTTAAGNGNCSSSNKGFFFLNFMNQLYYFMAPSLHPTLVRLPDDYA